MWLVYAILTIMLWGGADLFYKKGSNPDDKYSHLKIVVMVGLVMGIHGFYYMITEGISFDPYVIITYLPVSAMYILSMAFGYVGLRYIELSISSPIQNSSGAVAAVLIFIFFTRSISFLEAVSIIIITVGVVWLAAIERNAEEKALKEQGEEIEKRYRVGFKAILFPILYCIIDGLGTFADGIVLDELAILTEDEALLAYEFTFLICGIICLIYITLIKKDSFKISKQGNRLAAAILETGGQFFYVFAMAQNAIITAPLISSYSVFSIILSRIFLKEKLSKKQYFIIFLVIVGIGILGFADEL